VTNTELSDLLRDSLQLWGVVGRTSLEGDEVRVVTKAGHAIAIGRLSPMGKEWSVQMLAWPAAESPPARTTRICASVVPLLRTVRAVLSGKNPEARLRFASERPLASDGLR
jgi:hypothetical protein